MGGPGNPPDKPYVVKTLSDDDDIATGELQAARDAGFQIEAVVPFAPSLSLGSQGPTRTRVILGNYKTDGKKS